MTIGWVGDSRAYWLAGGATGTAPTAQLTTDDSWAAAMVASGALTEAAAYADEHAHAISAWLGADAGQVRPHVAVTEPGGPGVAIVCSDGLWNYLPEAAALAGGPTPPGGPAPLSCPPPPPPIQPRACRPRPTHPTVVAPVHPRQPP